MYPTFYVLCSRHKNTVKCASNEIRCMYVCGDENSWARVTQESHEHLSPASIDDYTVSFTQHRCIRPLGLWFNTSRKKSKCLQSKTSFLSHAKLEISLKEFQGFDYLLKDTLSVIIKAQFSKKKNEIQ